MIEVTQTDVYPLKEIKEGSSLRAFAKVVLNEEFAITSIRVVEGSKGLFVGFPQQKDSKEEGKYHDLAFPITKECRDRISDAILEEYANPTEKGDRPAPAAAPADEEPGSNW